MKTQAGRTLRATAAGAALLAVSACGMTDGDFDLRDLANGFDTSSAMQQLPARPVADERGVITYPDQQVAVSRQNDTIRGIAGRLGLDAQQLSQLNGIGPDVVLRAGELIALPTGAQIAAATGPLDVTTLASDALDRADESGTSGVTTTALTPAPIAEPEPEPTIIRHRVVRGETVFSISRLYDVSVSSIAEQNDLDAQFTIREGQMLTIGQGASQAAPQASTPVATTPVAAPVAAVATPEPTPEPVARVEPTPAPAPAPTPAATSSARFTQPVAGDVIRGYAPGRNEGIDIGAPAGSNVRAADAGTVAAVTTDTSGGGIVVIRHSDGLLTVYTQMTGLTVEKDDSVAKGEIIGKVRDANPSFLHFEVRRGLQSLDPADYL